MASSTVLLCALACIRTFAAKKKVLLPPLDSNEEGDAATASAVLPQPGSTVLLADKLDSVIKKLHADLKQLEEDVDKFNELCGDHNIAHPELYRWRDDDDDDGAAGGGSAGRPSSSTTADGSSSVAEPSNGDGDSSSSSSSNGGGNGGGTSVTEVPNFVVEQVCAIIEGRQPVPEGACLDDVPLDENLCVDVKRLSGIPMSFVLSLFATVGGAEVYHTVLWRFLNELPHRIRVLDDDDDDTDEELDEEDLWLPGSTQTAATSIENVEGEINAFDSPGQHDEAAQHHEQVDLSTAAECEARPLSGMLQEALQKLCSNDPEYKKCFLDDAGLSAEHMEPLAKALAGNTHVEELNLSGNLGIGDTGLRLLCKGIKTNRCLQALILFYTGLTSASMECLCEALMDHPALKKLSLAANNIGDAGVAATLPALVSLQQQIEVLDFDMTGITSAGLEDLLKLFEACPKLGVIGLSDNRLDDDGVVKLCSALTPFKACHSLGLYNNAITDRGVATLCATLVEFPALEYLSSLQQPWHHQRLGHPPRHPQGQVPNMILWHGLSDSLVDEAAQAIRDRDALLATNLPP